MQEYHCLALYIDNNIPSRFILTPLGLWLDNIVHKITVPDTVIRSQLARPTRLPGFNLSVKICIAVSVILVLFVLCCLRCVSTVGWFTVQAWRSGTLDLHSNLCKLSLAKPSQASSMGSLPKHSQLVRLREDVKSVYFWKKVRMDSFAAAQSTP